MPGKGKAKKTAKSKEERSDRMVEKKAAESAPAAPIKPVAAAGTSIKVTFSNSAAREALLYLEDSSGIERFMLKLDAGQSTERTCVSPAKWTVKVGGKELKVVADHDMAKFEIGTERIQAV